MRTFFSQISSDHIRQQHPSLQLGQHICQDKTILAHKKLEITKTRN